MKVPAHNANFTSPTAAEARQGNKRLEAEERRAGTTAEPDRDDRLSVSTRPTEPPPDNGIANAQGARASLERLKALLSENPAAAVKAHANIDPQSAAKALSLAA